MDRYIEVADDSGFLAIIDPDAYVGFVAVEWTLEQLRSHFQNQMHAKTLLIWGTGREDNWKVHVADQPVKSGFRERSGPIVSSRGRLLLTSYDSLSMAAQFADVSLPEKHESDQIVEVHPGIYEVMVVQLHDPDDGQVQRGPMDFLLSLQPRTRASSSWIDIPWSDL